VHLVQYVKRKISCEFKLKSLVQFFGILAQNRKSAVLVTKIFSQKVKKLKKIDPQKLFTSHTQYKTVKKCKKAWANFSEKIDF